MAINPQKLLPPAKLSVAERMAAAYDKKIDDLLNLKIKDKLINVDKLIKNTKKVKKTTRKKKKTSSETEQRKKREDRLEKSKFLPTSKLKLPSLPKTGFFDWIQNFIGYTFLGYLLTNYSDQLPRLMQVAKLLPSAMNIFGSILRGTVDFASTLIMGGYKARDDLSKMVKDLGGENAQKTFDEFTNNLKNLINSILTLGIYQAEQKSQKPKTVPQKYNGGLVKKMNVGGYTPKKVNTPVSREIKKSVTKRPPIVFRQVSQPGKDIGGREKIEVVFPSSTDRSKPGPLNTLMTTSSRLRSVPLIGPLMSAAVDIAMGQKPDKRIYRTFGDSLVHLIGPSIESQSNASLTSTILRMVGGGVVSRQISRTTVSPEQTAVLLSKIFERSIESKLTGIFAEILKTKNVEQVTTPSYPGAVSVSSDSPDFWLLAVAAMLENSDPQGAADVAQVIYNRVASPSWPGDIRSVILSGNGSQFQPVRDYGTVDAWRGIKDKESAVNFIERYGKGRNRNQLEQVASALLDSNRQRSAANFVGPRDSFRSISFEEKNNHLADDTEQRRHGHAFGFEPRGAQIGAFRAGKLSPAQVSATTRGTVTATTSPITGENGQLGQSQLTRVGTLYGRVDYQDWYGNGAYLRHDAARAFLAAKTQAQKEGIQILITSAYRSRAHQAALQGKYAVVAAPGTSRHGEGTALDIQTGTPGYRWFIQNGQRYGWIYAAIPGDPVHFEYNGTWRPTSQSQKRPLESRVPRGKGTEQYLREMGYISSVPRLGESIAMFPSYGDSETTIVLQEKIVLKETQTQTPPHYGMSNIDFPGVNSTIPTLIG